MLFWSQALLDGCTLIWRKTLFLSKTMATQAEQNKDQHQTATNNKQTKV